MNAQPQHHLPPDILPSGLTVYYPDAFSHGPTMLSGTVDHYHFMAVPMEAGGAFHLPDWPRHVVFVPHGSDLRIALLTEILGAGDSFAITGQSGAALQCISGNGLLLVAGGAVNPDATQPRIIRTGEHYKVSKPWGHELWINGEDPIFSFKEVHIRAGNQTSLQYHHHKVESNFLYHGACDLIYSAADDLTADHLAEMHMDAPTSLHITPHTLHRLRAKTDLYLYETSTPHLDDVIRVQDDAGRDNGRIATEHSA